MKKDLRKKQCKKESHVVIPTCRTSNKTAFTLAEVLITLGIIGVVAALTIPTLMQDYRKHVVEKQLKRVFSVMSQAIQLAENDYGEIRNWQQEGSANAIKKYLMPYIPGSTFISEAQLSHEQYYIYNSDKSQSAVMNGGWASAFRLKTGELIRVPHGFIPTPDNDVTMPLMFSLKYNKDNKYISGKDFFAFYVNKQGFLTPFSSSDTSCSRLNSSDRATYLNFCKTSYGHVYFCTAFIQCNNWQIPEDYPIKF